MTQSEPTNYAADTLRALVVRTEDGYTIRFFNEGAEPIFERPTTREETRMLNQEIWPALAVGVSYEWNLGTVGRMVGR